MNLLVAVAAAVPTMMCLNSKVVTIKIEVATQANVVTVSVTAVVVEEAVIMIVEAVIVIATIENEDEELL